MRRLRNSKQERFARAVAALEPLGTAYREAGYRGDPRWHPFNASRLANKPAVKARIEELRVEFERMSGIHVEYIRQKLLELLEIDPKEFYEPDPTDPTGRRLQLRPLTDLPPRLSRAISKLELDPVSGAPVKIAIAGKVEAAATLLRSLPGGSNQRHEHAGANGPPINIRVVKYTDEVSAEAAAKQEADCAAVPVVSLVRYDLAE